MTLMSAYRSKHFLGSITWLRLTDDAACIGEPETNGCAEDSSEPWKNDVGHQRGESEHLQAVYVRALQAEGVGEPQPTSQQVHVVRWSMLRHTVKSVLGRISPSALNWLRNHPAVNPTGEAMQPGGPHHRSYVGPPEDYDLIAGLTFSLLIDLGLRSAHQVCDLGCGSLRVGRLLIPYLDEGNYCGVDPNRWLVRRGIRWEVGRSQVRLRKPRFSYRNDFDLSGFGTSFDFVVAQSVFSHTFPDLLSLAVQRIGQDLHGRLVGTFVPLDRIGDLDRHSESGSGWLYPACVGYDSDVFRSILEDSGLTVDWLDWPHPRQKWFSATGQARNDPGED